MKISEIIPFSIRIPAELKEKIKESADKRLGASMNSEIVRRLEDSFETRVELAQFSDGELIDELIRRWGRDAVYIQLGKKPE